MWGIFVDEGGNTSRKLGVERRRKENPPVVGCKKGIALKVLKY
jgi:hypothetical protein